MVPISRRSGVSYLFFIFAVRYSTLVVCSVYGNHRATIGTAFLVQHRQKEKSRFLPLEQQLQRRLLPLSTTTLYNEDGNNGKKKKGYRFGDLTKSLVTKVTKKDNYEFGDLSRHIDKQVKDQVAKLNDKNDYEFGDLTRYVSSKVGYEFSNITSFNATNDYQFGDVSKAIIQRARTREYTMDDMFILMKTLVSFGVGLSPVSGILPVKLLVDLLNYSIMGDVTNKVTAAVAMELDKRMKKAVTGDEEYQVGDLTKKAVLKYTGKENYSFGDITKAVLESSTDDSNLAPSGNINLGPEKKSNNSTAIFLEDDPDFEEMAKEFEEWDKKFLKDVNIS